MTKDEALKLSLEALESCDAAHITDGGRQWYDEKLVDKAITAIKEALAQPEPCGGCKGSGWVPRDPDIGTDQECFVCGGSGAYPNEPEQEPVAIVDANDEGYWADILPDRSVKVGQRLYTAPAQRKPLTDEEIDKIWVPHTFIQATDRRQQAFARAIEAAHGIKGEA